MTERRREDEVADYVAAAVARRNLEHTRIAGRGGSLVVVDNILSAGAPGYEEYLAERDGLEWRTVRHDTRVEYRPDEPDVVLVSEYIG